MGFDIGSFSSKFKGTIDWMLKGKCSQSIKGDLHTYQRRKYALSTVPDAMGALKLLVETKVTNSFAREMSDSRKKGFDADLNSFLGKHKQNYRTPQAMDELTALIVKYSIFRIAKQKAKEWVEKLLGGYPTLKDFTEDLYRLRKRGENGLLRDKGADHYLRDVGCWDVIPIDVHEKRFLVRTGIYHAFSTKPRQDPTSQRSLQDALSRFCSLYLTGKTVKGIALDTAPGIVDLFIWSYCADKRYNICGSTPRCEDCGLRDACLFGITNIQKNISLGRIKFATNSQDEPIRDVDENTSEPAEISIRGHIGQGQTQPYQTDNGNARGLPQLGISIGAGDSRMLGTRGWSEKNDIRACPTNISAWG